MTYQGQDHVKADVLMIPKMWYFLRFEGFEPELLTVKVWSILDIDDVLGEISSDLYRVLQCDIE